MNQAVSNPKARAVIETGAVYCRMCTHTVDVEIERQGRRAIVRPGQKCPHCFASLGAAYVLPTRRAA